MADQDSGPDPLPPTAAEDLGDLPDEIAAPNCPRCLVTMEPIGEGTSVVWRCPQCRIVAL